LLSPLTNPGERHAEGEGCTSQPARKGFFTGTPLNYYYYHSPSSQSLQRAFQDDIFVTKQRSESLLW